MPLEQITLHECNSCHEQTAKVSWKSDSDGAAFTWITWYHDCQDKDCNFQEEKEIQHMYNQEDIHCCGVCNKEYIKPKNNY